jgi:hypothetical protein
MLNILDAKDIAMVFLLLHKILNETLLIHATTA